MIEPTVWKGIEGVVLDAVGTLIEPRPSVSEVYLAAALRQGIVLENNDVRNRFHRYFRNDEIDESLGPMVTTEAIERKRWKRIVTSVLSEVSDPDLAFEELWRHFAEPRHWRCFPDVAPALAFLKGRGFGLRIASNFDGRLRGVVKGLPEIADFQGTLVISSEVGFRKPHPEFYKRACESLGLPPERVLSVGDDLENDVLGPKRAGLRAILLERREVDTPEMPRCRSLQELILALGAD